MPYRKLLLAAAFGGALCAGPAGATIPVVDTRLISEASRIASNTSAQVNALQKLNATAEQILESIGESGSTDVFEGDGWSDFRDGGKMLEVLSQYAPSPCLGTEENCSGSRRFETIADGKAAIKDKLYAASGGGGGNAAGGNTYQRDSGLVRAREQAMRDSTLNGYAVALASRDYLSGAKERATSLENIVSGSNHLRGDVQGNSAVMLAVFQQLGQIQGLLTAVVEQQAVTTIRQDQSMDGQTSVNHMIER